jgi:uncharacterized membrane protein
MRTNSWNDEKVDRLIAGILQAGVLLAGAVVLIGGILYLVHFGGAPANYRVFDLQRAGLHGLRPTFNGLAHFESRAVIQIGILLLIATPVIRVAFSVLAFWLRRDTIYVPVTLVVLGILLYSLFGGMWK